MSEQYVALRWMIRRDMPEVQSIENASFALPWDEDNFTRALRHRNTSGMVAELSASAVRGRPGENPIVGFMLYELSDDHLYLWNFAVHPEHRRCGVGRQMLSKLRTKLSRDKRTHIDLHVSDASLHAQLFFRECGFRWVATEGGYFDNGADAYRMRYRFRGSIDDPSESRISHLTGVQS